MARWRREFFAPFVIRFACAVSNGEWLADRAVNVADCAFVAMVRWPAMSNDSMTFMFDGMNHDGIVLARVLMPLWLLDIWIRTYLSQSFMPSRATDISIRSSLASLGYRSVPDV